MSEKPAAELFQPHIGTPFRAGPPDGEVAFDLVSVDALREPPAAAPATVRRQPFSLIFRARTAAHLPQATYELRHDVLGRLALFLVPVGREPDGLLLQAVFA